MFRTGLTSAPNGGLVAGPGGNVWLCELDAKLTERITPAGAIAEFATHGTAAPGPTSITNGPDGNLWFTDLGPNAIGRMTPQGTIIEFSAGRHFSERGADVDCDGP